MFVSDIRRRAGNIRALGILTVRLGISVSWNQEESREYPCSRNGKGREYPCLVNGERSGNIRALGKSRRKSAGNILYYVTRIALGSERIWSSRLRAGPFYTPRPGLGVVAACNGIRFFRVTLDARRSVRAVQAWIFSAVYDCLLDVLLH